MSTQRLSASMKDAIKDKYNKKIRKLEEEIKDKEDKLADKIIADYISSKEYKEFKEQIIKFYDWLLKIDEDDVFSSQYHVRYIVDYLKDNNLFRKPYHSDMHKLFSNDLDIQSCNEKISALNKECNKLIWNIEMQPKASQEYKDAISKAEDLLFKGEKNEE